MFPSAIDPAEAPTTVVAPSANPAPQGWRALVPHLGGLFDDIPLAPGESREAFIAWREALLDEIAPSNVIELNWAREVALHEWDLARLERLRSELLACSSIEVVISLLAPNHRRGEAYKEAKRLAEAFVAGDRDAQATVALRLKRRGHSTSEISAKAYARDLKSLQDVERLMAGTRKQRDRLLREVERRRKVFAARLQAAAYVQTDDDGKPRSSHRADDQPVLAHPSNAVSPVVGLVRSTAAPEQDERLRWVPNLIEEGERVRGEPVAVVHQDERLRQDATPLGDDLRRSEPLKPPETPPPHDEECLRQRPDLRHAEHPQREPVLAQENTRSQQELVLAQEDGRRVHWQAHDGEYLRRGSDEPGSNGRRGGPRPLGEDERLRRAPGPLPEGHDSRLRASGPSRATGARDGH